MDKKKVIGTGLAIVGIIIGKLAIKFGASYGVTEAVVEASKTEPWDKEFKNSAVGACAQAVVTEAKKNNTDLSEADLNNYSNSYCSCIIGEVENEHIIPTKYNTYTMTEAEYSSNIDKIMAAYMESEKGDQAINNCIAQAQQTALRLPASEIEEGDDEGLPENAAASGTSSEDVQDVNL